MYGAMLNHADADDGRHLERCASASPAASAMPVEVMRAFEEKFGCKILEGYGLSETSPVASFNHPDKERKVGSIGTPIEGVEMKVVDDDGNEVDQGEVGEIVIKGHNVMKGYWNSPTRPRSRSRTAGSTPATWPRSTRTATSSSSTARRT